MSDCGLNGLVLYERVDLLLVVVGALKDAVGVRVRSLDSLQRRLRLHPGHRHVLTHRLSRDCDPAQVPRRSNPNQQQRYGEDH